MRKILEFVKIGGIWFYWAPFFEGSPNLEELRMNDGMEKLLDSVDSTFVRLQLIDPAISKITLSKMYDNELGAEYLCRSKGYSGKIFFCKAFMDEAFGNCPQNIYLKEI